MDEPSPTIRGVNRPIPEGYPIHSGDPVKSVDGIRPLTTKERSRIQTFPRDFVFLGNKTDQEQMIGNAVPVNLGKFIGECITQYIDQEGIRAECDSEIEIETCMDKLKSIYHPWETINGQIVYRLFEPEHPYNEKQD